VELEALHGADFDAAIEGALAIEDAAINLEGLALLATLSRGYPFFVQVYGSATWQAASSPRITAEDVERGKPIAETNLNGFFAARWGRATRDEQRYMRAIATRHDAGIEHAVAGGIAALPVETADTARAHLRLMGVVHNPDPDTVGFTDPLFWRFIVRQPT
jgi:hypothetical protein